MPFTKKDLDDLNKKTKEVEKLTHMLGEITQKTKRKHANVFSVFTGHARVPQAPLKDMAKQIEAAEAALKAKKQDLAQSYLEGMIECRQTFSAAYRKDALQTNTAGGFFELLLYAHKQNLDLDKDILFSNGNPEKYILDAVEDEEGRNILRDVFASENLNYNPYAREIVSSTLAMFNTPMNQAARTAILASMKALFDRAEVFFQSNPNLNKDEIYLFIKNATQIMYLATAESRDDFNTLNENINVSISKLKEPIKSAVADIYRLAEMQRRTINDILRGKFTI